jgi:uncharacterized RDD family membrane protein YckC
MGNAPFFSYSAKRGTKTPGKTFWLLKWLSAKTHGMKVVAVLMNIEK